MRGNTEIEKQIEILKDLLARGSDANPHVFMSDATDFRKNHPRCVPLLPILGPEWARSPPIEKK